MCILPQLLVFETESSYVDQGWPLIHSDPPALASQVLGLHLPNLFKLKCISLGVTTCRMKLAGITGTEETMHTHRKAGLGRALLSDRDAQPGNSTIYLLYRAGTQREGLTRGGLCMVRLRPQSFGRRLVLSVHTIGRLPYS